LPVFDICNRSRRHRTRKPCSCWIGSSYNRRLGWVSRAGVGLWHV